jgi:hypothetical protein
MWRRGATRILNPSRSMVERYVMTPLTVLLVICFIVAGLSQRGA